MHVLRRVPIWAGSPIPTDVINTPVTRVAPDEVFVFGSNADGFHGAGSAGTACRGDDRNNWREDAWFRALKYTRAGDPARVGHWAVYGMARGHQIGRTGQSYAVQTIARPGQRRSTPLSEIRRQVVDLVAFATERTDLRFIITQLGEGYSGYTRAEMANLWREVHSLAGIPESFRFVRLVSDRDPSGT